MRRVPAFLFAVLVLPLVMQAQDKATASLSITVNPAVVAVSPSTLPEGMVGTVYGGAGTTIGASVDRADHTLRQRARRDRHHGGVHRDAQTRCRLVLCQRCQRQD